jgi:oxaloacetate decarboxylase gamma subunit
MADLIGAGLELMLLGMGIVFAFLILLIATLKMMSAFAGKFDTPAPQTAPIARTVTDGGAANAAHVAVISAAIARFRATQGA